jgi:hypothetical protein
VFCSCSALCTGSLGGNYIGPEGVRRLEAALGIKENIRRNQPITAWRDSSPLTPLLLNRDMKHRRPSTVGPGGRRSILQGVERSSSYGTGMPILSPKKGSQRPSMTRSSTMSLIAAVDRPSSRLSPVARPASAFFDNKFTGEVTPSVLPRRPSSNSPKGVPLPTSPLAGGLTLPTKKTPMLAGSGSSIVHRHVMGDSMDAEEQGIDPLESMRNVGTDCMSVQSEEIIE